VDTAFVRTTIRLREWARGLEESAVILENAGYPTIPGELRRMAERLVEIREALTHHTGQSS
jgi:hypothetical protein